MLWSPHHLIRAKRTSFDFMGKRKIALVLSTAINLLSLVGVFVFGLNFGIDFEGGIAIQVRAKQGIIHLDELRSTLGGLGVGEVALQEFGDNQHGADPRPAPGGQRPVRGQRRARHEAPRRRRLERQARSRRHRRRRVHRAATRSMPRPGATR